jgi:ADP-heptose:LPS heptosyltransferase
VPQYKTDCRFFTGYKPCTFKRPCEDCPHHDPIETEILIINLDAMGDVMRSTALLPVLKRAYPRCRIQWLTRKSAAPLLQNNPLLDRVWLLNDESIQTLLGFQFDLICNIDKDRLSGSLAVRIPASDKRGFGIDRRGNIVMFNKEAQLLYDVGLDDELKANINKKNEQQLVAETMGFAWQRDPYVLQLTDDENATVDAWRSQLDCQVAIGVNTGCAATIPYKKLTESGQVQLIRHMLARCADLDLKIVLLGGPPEEELNERIAAAIGDPRVVQSPCREGVRRGILYEAACDVICSGDTLGMHIAIALGKYVVTWFAPTCAHEIDLYDRGTKIDVTMDCAPCWRHVCDKTTRCQDLVDTQFMADEAIRYARQFLASRA